MSVGLFPWYTITHREGVELHLSTFLDLKGLLIQTSSLAPLLHSPNFPTTLESTLLKPCV